MKTQSIKKALLQGKKLSSLDAVKLFNTIKLTSRISELRREGMNIKDEWRENKKTKSRYKVYWL